MNFLQLCQRLRRKCRVSGTGPTSVANQSEEYARLVDFINEAWMILQRKRPDWKWMRGSMSFPTVADQAEYTLAQIEATGAGLSNFGNWQRDTFRCYTTATGTNDENVLSWLDYDMWRDTYQFGATRHTQTRPTQFTITPVLGIGLGCTPIVGYTITGDYYKVAAEMEDDGDTPLLPSQFHMAIVYRAMMIFGVAESKPWIYDEGLANYNAILGEIELQQLPEIQAPGALA